MFAVGVLLGSWVGQLTRLATGQSRVIRYVVGEETGELRGFSQDRLHFVGKGIRTWANVKVICRRQKDEKPLLNKET